MGGHTLPAGAMVALATPMTEAGELDPHGMERLVGHVVAGGVRGFCPTGSTGEGARLSTRQRIAVARLVRDLVPPDTHVIPGIPASSLEATLTELDGMATTGAVAVLVAPPSYFPGSDATVERLYRTLADRTALPIVLYNIPQFTKVAIAPRVVRELAAHPRVVGIKDSSRDMEYLLEVLDAVDGVDDFRVLTGTDTLLVASLVAGADGAIAASANLCPDLGSAICATVDAGELDHARDLQRQLRRVVTACRRGEFPAGWKAALEARGICGSALAPPAAQLDRAARAALAHDLESLGVLGPQRV